MVAGCWIMIYYHFQRLSKWIKKDYQTPLGDDAGSKRNSRRNDVVKYTAQLDLSAVSRAAKTGRKSPRLRLQHNLQQQKVHEILYNSAQDLEEKKRTDIQVKHMK